MEAFQTRFERHECKYLITPAQYEALKRGMAEHTAPDVHPRYTLCNIYFDTPDFRLIRDSLEKPAYKEKLRLRSYGLASRQDTVFLEMKKKLNGLVYKRRIDLPLYQAEDYLSQGTRPTDDNQICREIDWMRRCYDLSPRVFIGYDREAYSGTEDPELRITFDTGIRWRTEELDLSRSAEGEALDLGGKILLEVKFPGTAPFWLSRLMNELGIRRTSFSKYGEVYKRHLFYTPQAPDSVSVPAAQRGSDRLLRRAAAAAAAINF